MDPAENGDCDNPPLDELVDALKDELGPGAVGPADYQRREGAWLPNSWLGIALKRVCQQQDADLPAALGPMPARQRLVAICNVSGADVEHVLEADDPRVEVEAVYRAVVG